ncbi:MAG TPA: hypothetical protein VF202_02245 [Trueperaceae bacterium]
MKRDLTPAMRRQLAVIRSGRGTVNLATVRALISRGLARERFGGELASHSRLASGYALTAAGAALARELDPEEAP